VAPGVAPDACAAPQPLQNRAPGTSVVPHSLQAAGAVDAPQLKQNRAPSGSSVVQLGHALMTATLSLTGSRCQPPRRNALGCEPRVSLVGDRGEERLAGHRHHHRVLDGGDVRGTPRSSPISPKYSPAPSRRRTREPCVTSTCPGLRNTEARESRVSPSTPTRAGAGPRSSAVATSSGSAMSAWDGPFTETAADSVKDPRL
jgi:hypothetical protein